MLGEADKEIVSVPPLTGSPSASVCPDAVVSAAAEELFAAVPSVSLEPELPQAARETHMDATSASAKNLFFISFPPREKIITTGVPPAISWHILYTQQPFCGLLLH